MSALFCGIDASIRCTGLSVIRHVEGDKFYLEDKTSITTGRIVYQDRFLKKIAMFKMYMGFLQPKLDSLSFCVFENYSYGGKGSIADLAELNGMMKYFLYLNDIPVDVLAPSAMKKWVAGHGQASKKQVAEGLKNYLVNYDDIIFNNNDESDSCAIAVGYGLKMLEHIS